MVHQRSDNNGTTFVHRQQPVPLVESAETEPGGTLEQQNLKWPSSPVMIAGHQQISLIDRLTLSNKH